MTGSAHTKFFECECTKCVISVAGESDIYGKCHCKYCESRATYQFSLGRYFTTDNVTLLVGEVINESIEPSDLHLEYKRVSCSNCISTLFWKFESMGNYVGISHRYFT